MGTDISIPPNKLHAVIKAKCMDCSGHSKVEVEKCPLVPVYVKRTLVRGCPLWPYRQGLPTTADEKKIKRIRRTYVQEAA